LEPPKIKSVTVSIVSPSICHEVMGQDAIVLVIWIWEAGSGGGEMGVPIADSYWYLTENDKFCKAIIFQLKIKFKKVFIMIKVMKYNTLFAQ